MSNRVDGLSIVFDIEATSFNKGLNQINKEIKSSEKLTKSLDKQIQETFDPTDVTQFNSKLSLLESTLAGTEEKTAALTKELDRMAEAGEDATNPLQYQKLQKELIETTIQQSKLNTEIDKTNQNIEAIETQQYDKLDNSIKKAAVSQQKLTAEQVGWNSAADKSTKSSKELSKSIGTLDDNTDNAGEAFNVLGSEITNFTGQTSFGNSAVAGLAGSIINLTKTAGPAGAAIAGVAAGITFMYKEMERANEVSLSFAGSIFAAEASTESLADSAKKASRVFDVEYSEAVDLTKTSMQLYDGATISATDTTQRLATTIGITNLEYIDLEKGISAVKIAQTNYNSSIDESIALLISANQAVEVFGGAADDLIDSFIEFGDTVIPAVGGLEDFFNVLVTGLTLGAKNTDEIVNSINELILRTGEMSDEFLTALDAVGVSYSDLVDSIENENLEEVLLDIINGLAELETQTERTAIAGQLFGTYGEELIATIAGSEESVTALNEAYAILEQRELVQIAVTDNLTANFQTLGVAAGLTAEQQEQYNIALEQGLPQAFAYLKSLLGQAGALGVLIANSSLAEEQQNTLTEALTIAGESGRVAAISFLAQAGALQVLYDQGLITKEQLDILTTSSDNLANANTNATTRINGFIESLIEEQEQLGISNSNVRELEKSLEVLNDDTATAEQKQIALSNALVIGSEKLGITNKQAGDLAQAFKFLSSDTTTAEQKTQAFTDIVDILASSSLPSAQQASANLQKAYDDLDGGLSGVTGQTESLTDDLIENQRELAPTTRKVADLTDAVNNSLTPWEQYQAGISGATSALYDYQAAANTTEIVDPGASGLGSRVADIGANSFSTASNVPTVPVSTNNTPNFNIEININSTATNIAELVPEIAQPLMREVAKYL